MKSSKTNDSRRDFIKMNSLLSLGMLTGGSAIATTKRDAPAHGTVEKITNVAGMPLTQLRAKYQKELFDHFLPNMDKYAIDHEFGGVMCSLNVKSGELINSNKTAWFVGRGMWVYSFLYNNIKKDPRYLEIARKSKDIALKVRPKDDNFWPHTFSKQGEPISGPGDIYGSLFVAEGLAEYAVASGESEYRQLAKKIIFDCVERYDRPDYKYNIGSYLPNAPDIESPRILGHWMIFLSLSTQMLKHAPDPELEKLAARSVDAILNRHVNKNYGLTNEVLNHDFSLPDNAYSQFSIIGHGLETLTFVMFEAARLKNKDLFKRASEVHKKHVDVATDAVYGGYFHALEQVDEYHFSTRKSLWCQQEVLNGSLFLIEHTGDEWGFRNFERASNYVYDKFYDANNKFWYSGSDRKVEKPQVNLLEHYHHARELMLGILSMNRMIDRKGKISGIFG
jgi:mannose/cellobiose epimerase-like protein (N-acyl-D-glucosamine 2-epimerase family)